MKKFLLYALIITIFSLNSCSDLTNIETESSGYKWEVSSPDKVGLNEAILNSALSEASSKGFINSLLVIRNGKIAAEKYFNGRNPFSTQTVRSVSKSFLSALVGIDVSKGLLRLDQKMMESFPEYKLAVTDSRVNNITLRHLLTMRSGIKGDVEAYFTFTSSSNWIRTIINLPLNFDPGSKSGYSTAGTHLIAGMLTKASGLSLLEFAQQNLFEPMGIEIKDWLQDPQGICFGGNDMIFTTRNMAVLGLLYLNNGNMNGKQIVPEEWVKSSLVYSGGSSSVWGSLTNLGYGYLWWIGKATGKNVFFALGHGGQYVMCVPDLNMIIAATSDPNLDWDISDEHERAVIQIIADYIIPSAGNLF
jgi:CubicO group peptidase (beta-lactamase class C family)